MRKTKQPNLIEEMYTAKATVNWDVFWDQVDAIEYRHTPQVMRMLYRQDGTRSDMVFRKVGETLGISTSRVNQIKVKAIRILRHPVRFREYGTFVGISREATT